MHAGHIQPTASERHRPVSASISSLLGSVRKDRPGPLRRQTWQMTHSVFMVAPPYPAPVASRSPKGCGSVAVPSGNAVGASDHDRLGLHLERRALWQSGRSPMSDHNRCHVCRLGIEMRYGEVRPMSSAPGYWAHLDTVDGIAAEGDHDAVR